MQAQTANLLARLTPMKPKELLIARLQEHIVPFMAERGFRFARSQLRFTRSADRVRHEIEVCSDRHNSTDNCTFWTMWAASAPAYTEWHQGQWSDEKPRGDTLASLADWNIPNWSRAPAAPRRTLTDTPEDAVVMASFRADIEHHGLPFLARVSTWEGAAELLRKDRWMYDRAADFLLIAGRAEEARAALLEGINTFEVMGRSDTFNELPRLKRRLARYFGA